MFDMDVKLGKLRSFGYEKFIGWLMFIGTFVDKIFWGNSWEGLSRRNPKSC